MAERKLIRDKRRYLSYFPHKVDAVNIMPSITVENSSVLRNELMRTRYFLIPGLLLCSVLGSPRFAHCQNESDGGRKIVRKVEPHYPEVARRMNLSGTVKVIAVVAQDGNVKKVEAVGGSPVLVEAAQSAISQWKYAPGAESREPIVLHFSPQ